MTTDNIPRAVHSETLRVGDVEVEVHVLEDGRRIIECESFLRLLGIVEPLVLSDAEADQ